MNNTIYENNMKILKKNYPNIFLKLENKEYELDSTYDFIEDENIKNKKVLMIVKDSKSWYLNSKYSEEKSLSIWSEQFKDISYSSVIQFYGLGTGDYVKRLLDVTEKTVKIILFEPSTKIFLHAMENTDLSFIESDRIGLSVAGLNDDDLNVFLKGFLDYSKLSVVQYLCSPNYDTIFGDKYKEYMENIRKHVSILVLDRNTEIRFSDEITRNVRENMKYIVRSFSLEKLIESIPKDITAIIVSAGPSLNINIKGLKEAKGKALIIATDTAVKPLIKEGIIPDLFVTVDPSKPMILFDKEEVFDIPMLITESGNTQVVERHRGKKFFSSTGNGFLIDMFEKYKKGFSGLSTGGSVANNAFSLAVVAGIKTIILIGQDLAYPGNKSHADGTFEEKMKEKDMSGSFYLNIEDINGNIIRTSQDFKYYLEWFEREIGAHPEIRVIDATEGGAKIHGAEIMSFKKAISEECVKDVNVSSIINKIPPLFIEDEVKELEQYISRIPDELVRIKRKINEGIKLYEYLAKLLKNKLNSKEILKVNKHIKKMTNYIEKEEIMQLILPYMKFTDYQIKSKVYQVKGNAIEDGMDISEKGIHLLETMLETIEKLEPEFEKLKESFLEEE